MNASMLAALSSPGGSKTPARRSGGAAFSTDKSKRAAAGAPGAGAGAGQNKENSVSAAKPKANAGGSRAPAFTVPEAPSTPWRMENLRVLIEEGKKAAAEGRLSAALRKYETAMVTLPEAYKPRLRNKIARLEARLDDEEARSPGTPARLSRKACREAAQSFGAKDPGPLDLLQVAVNDIAAAAAAAGGGGGGGSASGRLIAGGTFSSPSPRRSSPQVRGLAGAGDATPNASGVAGKRAMTPRDQDLSFGIDRLGDRLTASSLTASTTAADPVGAPTSPVRSPLPASLCGCS